MLSAFRSLRGVGPSLGSAGVAGTLQDPTARLLDTRGRTLDLNDDWMQNPDKDAIIATGLAPTDPRESALIDTLGQRIYTMVEQGSHRGVGICLPEIYDRLEGSLQLSAVGIRGSVLTGDNVMINGFILRSSGSVSVLLRVLGPTLANAGLSDVLNDPTLELHDNSGTLIASNDNWRDTQESEIIATGLAPSDDRESAIAVTLPPGAYTSVVRGFNATTGLGFLQIYSLAFPVRELNPAPKLRRSRLTPPTTGHQATRP